MRIVHVTAYYPPHLGGMEYRTKDLAENFAEKGYQVTVITSDIGSKTGQLTGGKNLTIHYLKSLEIAHTPIIPLLPLRLLLLPADTVIHLHIAQAFIAEITGLICIIRKFPYVAHIHLDVEPSGVFGFLLPWYKKLFLRPVITHANAVTVLTEDYKKLMCDKYRIPPQKITVIPNGTYFKRATDVSNTLHTPVRLLFVGRLSVQKNLPLLLEALHICVHQYKMALHLTIAGDGEKKAELQQQRKDLQLEDYCTLLGQVTPVEAQNLYNEADILVFPSRSESFGSVIIEAMACGVVVITTDIPGIRNIVTDRVNGLLTGQDSTEFAQAIRTVIEDPGLRCTLITNGLEESKKYTWDHVIEQYEELYSQITRH